MHKRELVRIGTALLKDAIIQAAAGSGPERENIRAWINGAEAAWPFEITISILGLDENVQRKRIERMLDHKEALR